MQSSKCKFEHIDLEHLTLKCLLRDMGNTCEVSSLYHMSKGNITIVQKYCSMQITNLALTFDIFTPPPKKKNIRGQVIGNTSVKYHYCMLKSNRVIVKKQYTNQTPNLDL